jgi:hypothetical protein
VVTNHEIDSGHEASQYWLVSDGTFEYVGYHVCCTSTPVDGACHTHVLKKWLEKESFFCANVLRAITHCALCAVAVRSYTDDLVRRQAP